MRALSDQELKGITPGLKERLEKGEELDSILPEAFAAVREAARRTITCATSTSSSSEGWCSTKGR